jgi:hypothetical protein
MLARPSKGAHFHRMGWRFIITAIAMLGGSFVAIELLAATLTQLAAR